MNDNYNTSPESILNSSPENNFPSFEVIQSNKDAVRTVFKTLEDAHQAITEFWNSVNPTLVQFVKEQTELTSGDRTMLIPAKLPNEKSKGEYVVIFRGNNQQLSPEAVAFLANIGITI